MTAPAGAHTDRFVLGWALAATSGIGCLVLDLWLAAGMSSLAATGRWTSLSLAQAVPALLRSGPTALAGGDPALFWTVISAVAVVELVLAFVVAMRITAWLSGRYDPSRLARRRDLGDLAGRKADAKARGLRPSLADTQGELGRDRGIRLLQVDSQDVWMSWEDVALVLMGPRSNKTSAVAVPTILSATGPVVATSNRSDVWSLTRDLRAEVGTVRTFDAQQITYGEQTWYTDPVDWIRPEHPDRQLDAATRFISHFVGTIKGNQANPFFTNAAERVAVTAMLAAVATPDGTLRDVLTYLADHRWDAVRALDSFGFAGEAEQLESTLHGADVTVEGVFETARTALKCLRSEAVIRWLTPPETWLTPAPAGTHIEKFDPWTLFTGAPDTLYLLSKEGGASSAPVVTAFVDRITDVAERTAQARGGRLDPSLVLMLDEAANVCPLQNLPQQFSHWGGRSINALCILQNYKQGARVWGREGMDALWSAATVKLAGAGIDDVDFLSWMSQLIGERWVAQPVSFSRDHRNGFNEQFGWTKQPILPISSLRALPKTDAMLITPGRPIARGKLLPWYTESDDAAEIKDASARATEEIRAAAIAYLGPDNPVARVLAGAP